jgi:hypothetical protein
MDSVSMVDAADDTGSLCTQSTQLAQALTQGTDFYQVADVKPFGLAK